MASLLHTHFTTAADAVGGARVMAPGTGIDVPCAGALRSTRALAERDAG